MAGRIGRPKTPKRKQRLNAHTVRFTGREQREIERAAKREGQKMATYIHDQAVIAAEVPTLDALADAMRANHPFTLDQHGQWRSDLPAYGGETPSDTQEVWSWDSDRLLVGTCADDLQIVGRD